MNISQKICTILLMLSCINSKAQTTWFVSPSGNDGGSGSITSPFLTVQKAVSEASDYDTIELRSGHYLQRNIIRVPKNYITIRSYRNEWAILEAPVNDVDIDAVVWFNDPDMDGGNLINLEIVGGYYYGVKTESNFDNRIPGYPNNGVQNVNIIHCKIHDTGRDCIKLTPASNNANIVFCEIYNSGVGPANIPDANAEGIDNVNCDNVLVYACYIHDISTNGLYHKGGAANCITSNNLVVNCGNGGIALGYLDTDEEYFDLDSNPTRYENINGIVSNNIIINTAYEGIGLYAVLNAKIYNNTVVNTAKEIHGCLFISRGEVWISSGELTPPCTNLDISNNIFSNHVTCNGYMIETRENVSQLNGTNTFKHNIYYNNGNAPVFSWFGNEYTMNQWISNTGLDSIGSNVIHPMLDMSMHLSSASPCINAGYNLGTAIPSDYDNEFRIDDSIDIGADEYSTSGLQIPPPTGIIGTGINDDIILEAQSELNPNWSFYPSIVHDYLYIENCISPTTLHIYTYDGRIIKTIQVNSTYVALPISDLPSNTYLLQMNAKSKPFIKL